MYQPDDCSRQNLENQGNTSKSYQPAESNHKPITVSSNSSNVQNRQSDSPSFSTDSNFSDTVKPIRPPIAFMIFANEWRAKLSEKYPEDNNKEISVRLSTMWKRMPAQQKAKYYYLARKTQSDKDARNNSLHIPKVRKEKEWRPKESILKAETENDVPSDKDSSSDGLEIVEEETELIQIDEDNSEDLAKNDHTMKENIIRKT